MVVITPLMLAGGQFALSAFQGFLGHQAKQQDYLNQRAQQKASDEFARWTASNQARTQDLNNSYRFYQEQVNYGQELAYASQMRNFELAKSINQAEVVARTRASATADYSQQSGALAEAFQQQSMADAISMMQYKQQALRSQASASTTMQEGRSVDRYINDYARQVGDMEAMRQLNEGFERGNTQGAGRSDRDVSEPIQQPAALRGPAGAGSDHAVCAVADAGQSSRPVVYRGST